MSKLFFVLALHILDQPYVTSDLNLLMAMLLFIPQDSLSYMDPSSEDSEFLQCLYCHRQDAARLWGIWLQDRLRWETDVFFYHFHAEIPI